MGILVKKPLKGGANEKTDDIKSVQGPDATALLKEAAALEKKEKARQAAAAFRERRRQNSCCGCGC